MLQIVLVLNFCHVAEKNESQALKLQIVWNKSIITFEDPVRAIARWSFLFIPPDNAEEATFFLSLKLNISIYFWPSTFASDILRPFSLKTYIYELNFVFFFTYHPKENKVFTHWETGEQHIVLWAQTKGLSGLGLVGSYIETIDIRLSTGGGEQS